MFIIIIIIIIITIHRYAAQIPVLYIPDGIRAGRANTVAAIPWLLYGTCNVMAPYIIIIIIIT